MLGAKLAVCQLYLCSQDALFDFMLEVDLSQTINSHWMGGESKVELSSPTLETPVDLESETLWPNQVLYHRLAERFGLYTVWLEY